MASSPVLATWVRTRRRPSLARERHQDHSILSGPFLTMSIAPVSDGATIGLVLLDFSLYDQSGSIIGNHSVTMRKLDAHGAGQIEETLPSQYAEWKWTVWSMKLASAVAN